MKRSFDPAVLEMMDRPQSVSAELERDLKRIRQLNRWFGSYRLVFGFMRRWIKPGDKVRIVDLATGSGDIPRLIVSYARKIGAKVEIDVTHVFSQLLRIRGIGVGSRADLLAVLRAMETRRIRPVIDREFSSNEVSAAFRHFKAGAHFGKVVIRATLSARDRVHPSTHRPKSQPIQNRSNERKKP